MICFYDLPVVLNTQVLLADPVEFNGTC